MWRGGEGSSNGTPPKRASTIARQKYVEEFRGQGYTRSKLPHRSSLFLPKGQMDSRSIAGGIRPRVLVADDERIIADTLGMILSQNGFEAATVYGGQKAVETARIFHPDVFLADVVMPGMSGIEAAIQISSMIPSCRVVLLSGQAATADLLRDARVRGHEFEILLKPVHPSQLLDRLRLES